MAGNGFGLCVRAGFQPQIIIRSMKQNITRNVQPELFALPDAKPVLNAGAEFSECGLYRYRLWRIWDESKPLAMCIGLNPSTANANKNDQTISYLMKMLGILGYGGFYMMNCWALISSDPKALIDHRWNELICDWNDNMITVTAAKCKDVVFCWGGFKIIREAGRDKELIEMFPKAKCFGKNDNGSPFHPLAMMPRNGRDPNNPMLQFYCSDSNCI